MKAPIRLDSATSRSWSTTFSFAVAAIREKFVTVDEADHLPGAAELAVAACAARADSVTNTVGPELPSFLELVKGRLLGRGCPRDVLLTGDEHRAMTARLADTGGSRPGQRGDPVDPADRDSLRRTDANEIDRDCVRRAS